MGRRKSYVNPAAAERLARSLRRLHDRAGFSYRELAEKTFYNHARVWRAINGQIVPTWEMTWDIVRECHSQLAYPARKRIWKRRWNAVRTVRLGP